MNGKRLFLDTNVLVYLFDNDAADKQARAAALLQESEHIYLSTQVLQEFYVTVTRKLAQPLSPQQALRAVEHFMNFPVAQVSPEQVTAAIRRSIDSRLSYWDALIVESAVAAGVDLLVSEDLQDGWRIGSMQVWNPFAD